MFLLIGWHVYVVFVGVGVSTYEHYQSIPLQNMNISNVNLPTYSNTNIYWEPFKILL